jgi:hypothetical protein
VSRLSKGKLFFGILAVAVAVPALSDAASISTVYDMNRMLNEPHPMTNEYGTRWAPPPTPGYGAPPQALPPASPALIPPASTLPLAPPPSLPPYIPTPVLVPVPASAEPAPPPAAARRRPKTGGEHGYTSALSAGTRNSPRASGFGGCAGTGNIAAFQHRHRWAGR